MIETLKSWSGLVALVILAIMGLSGQLQGGFGSASACTDGYTCFTNLEVQGNQIVDGTMAASSSLQLTGALTVYGASTLTGTTTIKNSLLLRDSDSATCIDGYATSSATPIKFVFTATTTVDGQSVGAGLVTFNYGTCP